MIPKIEITDNERLWLNEAWQQLLVTGNPPEYKTIRKNTLPATGADFNPMDINKFLIKERATEITFLGVLHAVPDTPILKDGENLMMAIKRKLWEADDEEIFIISELSKDLGLHPQYGKIVFALMTDFGDTYSGASAKATVKSRFDYDEYTIKGDRVFDAYMSFTSLEKKISDHYKNNREFNKTPTEPATRIGGNALWLDENGNLQYDTLFGQTRIPHKHFINPSRIKELKKIKSDFDFLKLLHLCKEINFNYAYDNFYAVALLSRALIDHVPPIFKCRTVEDVVNNYNAENNVKSFRASMKHLDNSLRNIGDSLIHSMIRKSEVVPNETQIDFKNDIDVLLAEIVRILK